LAGDDCESAGTQGVPSCRGRPPKEMERFKIDGFYMQWEIKNTGGRFQANHLHYDDIIMDIICKRTEVATRNDGQFSYLLN